MLKRLMILLFAFSSASLFAAEMNPDGSSGCGYGWEVTKEKTLFASSTRNTTNQTASNTIAMTMGTSGCEKHDIVMQQHQQEHFAAVNMENIIADMAQGQGEYLVSFAGVLGCGNASAFGKAAQQNLDVIAADNATELLNNIKTNAAIRSACM